MLIKLKAKSWVVVVGLLSIGILVFKLNTSQNDSADGQENPYKSEHEICQLKLGWSEWSPYLTEGVERPDGFQIELVSWIAAEMGCEISYKKLTWSEGLVAIENGSIDFMGRASKLPEREKYAYFSDSYRQDMLQLAGRRENSKWGQGLELKQLLKQGFVIGLLSGGYFGSEIEQLRTQPEYLNSFKEYALEKDILDAIANAQIDGIFEEPFVIETANNLSVSGKYLDKLPVTISIGDLHFMFSKKSVKPALVDKFNQALVKVKQSDNYTIHWFWTMVL